MAANKSCELFERFTMEMYGNVKDYRKHEDESNNEATMIARTYAIELSLDHYVTLLIYNHT